MKKFTLHLIYFSCVTLLFSLPGCALIFQGTKQQIYLDSKPQGATVTAQVKSKKLGITPFIAKVPRRSDEILLFEHPQGGTFSYLLIGEINKIYLLGDIGLIVGGGIVPVTVDFATGAIYKYQETHILVDFSQKNAGNTDFDNTSYFTKEKNIIKRKAKDSLFQVRLEKKSKRKEIRIAHYNKIFLSKPLNTFTLNLTQLRIAEVQVGYERLITPKSSLEFCLGIKIPKTYSGIYDAKRTPYNDVLLMPFSNSFYVSGAYKKYLETREENLTYYSIGAFYRYSFYEEVAVTWHDPTFMASKGYYKYDAFLDARIHSMGVKFLWGFTPTFKISDKTGIRLDLYGGLSLRLKHPYVYYHKLDADFVWGYYYSDYKLVNSDKHSITFIPGVQFGLKAGISWK